MDGAVTWESLLVDGSTGSTSEAASYSGNRSDARTCTGVIQASVTYLERDGLPFKLRCTPRE